MSQQTFPALVSTAAVVVGGAAILLNFSVGPISSHMAMHIAIMNVTAPVLAAGVLTVAPSHSNRLVWLWTAAAFQLLLLLAWHAPYFHVVSSHLIVLATTTALLISATAFWLAVLRIAPAAPWHAILALLVTGKIACLLGAILVFAPRFLYGSSHSDLHAGLGDQQLAGLLMISACPLSYIVAGVVIAAQMMFRLEREAQERPAAGRLAS